MDGRREQERPESVPVRIKRAYTPPGPEDGYRVLVDRRWPRGVSRDAARLDAWERELAPSDELRRWYGHRPERFPEFRWRYTQELTTKAGVLDELTERARDGPLTLVFAARDADHSNARVLADLLEGRLGTGGHWEAPAI
jgi:uncharacterized protein YeaO (DUF488 family)